MGKRRFERDLIPYALETDCPLGAGGFEPLHLEIRSASVGHPLRLCLRCGTTTFSAHTSFAPLLRPPQRRGAARTRISPARSFTTQIRPSRTNTTIERQA
jgi:hypothetical protein